MNKPLVSVIVPIYNVERYLYKCVDSIVNQTYTNLDIILVDDGSPDKSGKICDDYENKDPRIHVVHKVNGGVSSSRNTGMQIANGEYILFVDGDDWLSANCVDLAIKEILKNSGEIVMWTYIKEFSNKSVERRLFSKSIVFNSTNISYLRKRILGLTGDQLRYPQDMDSLSPVWGKLYLKSIITDKQIEFLDTKEIGNEDALFNICVFQHVTKVSFINEYLYHYRKDNETALTVKYNENLLIRWINLFNLMKLHIKKFSLGTDYQQALNNRIALSILGLGLNLLKSKDGTKQKIIEIKNILHMDFYREAVQTLSLKHSPLHWKIFYTFAKMGMALPVYWLLCVIKKIQKSNAKG